MYMELGIKTAQTSSTFPLQGRFNLYGLTLAFFHRSSLPGGRSRGPSIFLLISTFMGYWLGKVSNVSRD